MLYNTVLTKILRPDPIPPANSPSEIAKHFSISRLIASLSIFCGTGVRKPHQVTQRRTLWRTGLQMDHQETPFIEYSYQETSHLQDVSCCFLLEYDWLIDNCEIKHHHHPSCQSNAFISNEWSIHGSPKLGMKRFLPWCPCSASIVSCQKLPSISNTHSETQNSNNNKSKVIFSSIKQIPTTSRDSAKDKKPQDSWAYKEVCFVKMEQNMIGTKNCFSVSVRNWLI